MRLYALACYDKETGGFVEFVRKGRSNAIFSYDSLDSAKRGLSQTKRTNYSKMYNVHIVKFSSLEVLI